MKKLSILSVFTLLSLLFNSCDKYIDITPKGAVTIDSAYTYLELIGNPQRTFYPTSFAFLSDDAWAKESAIIGNEYTSLDGILFTFNEQADRTIIGDNNLYVNIYKDILRCNLVIDNIDNAPGTDEIRTLAKAEARCYRAFNHFLAVNLYAKSYDPATAASDGGIAIADHYTLEETFDKSTVAEAYDFIISELEASVPLLSDTPLNIYHPNRAFGWAMLAKAYLFHRDWKKAEDAARRSLAINNELVDYNYINSKGGVARCKDYADTGNPEVISYMWYGGNAWTAEQVCLYSYGIISPELVNLFDTTNDLRYSLFFKQSGTTIEQWYDKGSGSAIWTTANTTSRFSYMSAGMRTAEVYLMLAEALARQNQLTESTDLINTLRKNRIKGATAQIAQPANEHDMMETIILERRKELIFGFHRFFDLKRFNLYPEFAKTITRKFPVVTTSVPQKTYTLLPTSPLYILPFPKAVTEKNPNLTPN